MLALISSTAEAIVFIFADIFSAAPATSPAFTEACSAALAIAFILLATCSTDFTTLFTLLDASSAVPDIEFILPAIFSTASATSLAFTEDALAVLAIVFILCETCSVAFATTMALEATSSALFASCLLTLESFSAEPAKLSESVCKFFIIVCSLEAKESMDLDRVPNSSPRLSPERAVISPFSILATVRTTFFKTPVMESVK